jgi:hypothetical protein
VSYSEWKRNQTGSPNTPANWETGPPVQKGVPDSAKMRHLWGLDRNTQVAGQAVTTLIKQLAAQQKQQPQVQQRQPAPTPAPRAANFPLAPMMIGPDNKQVDVRPVIAKLRQRNFNDGQIRNFLTQGGYH